MDYTAKLEEAVKLLTNLGFRELDRQGVIYRHVIEDPKLSLEAKGVYAILSSLQPLDCPKIISVNKLSTIAHTCSATFLKYRQELIEAGYLSIQVHPPFNNGPRTYVLHNASPAYSETVNDEFRQISITDVTVPGYVNISCVIMALDNLSLRDKGVYAYLLNSGDKIPPVKSVAQLLNVHHSSIYASYKKLRELDPALLTRISDKDDRAKK